MKAFQGGTTLAVGGNVRRLRALFGDGRIEREGTDATSLAEILSKVVNSPDLILEAFNSLRDDVDSCLDGLVQPHHLEVMWRRLREAGPSRGGQPLTAAQRPDSPLVHATTRGDLSALVESARSEPTADQAPSPLRLAVIQGGNR
jgi:hypothetical protein